MILEVLKFPDPRLRKKAQTVAKVTPELRKLAEDMLETMYSQKGIGLAATQVGELVRMLVMDTRPKGENGEILLEEMTELERQVEQQIVIFNPELISAEEKTTYDEGCLSVPGFFETVERNQIIKVRGLNKDGHKIEIHSDGLLAICLQHEMDHLDGKLFIDHLSLVKSNRIKSRIKKHGYPTPEEARAERAEKRTREPSDAL